MNSPASSVMTTRFTPVPVWIAVIATPGTTAPDGSLAIPLIWETACAPAWAHVRIATNRIVERQNRRPRAGWQADVTSDAGLFIGHKPFHGKGSAPLGSLNLPY